jgi:hypothetical protein
MPGPDLLDNLPLVRMEGTTDREVDAFVRAAHRAARLRVEKRRLLDLTDPLKDFANAIVLVAFVMVLVTVYTRVVGSERLAG